MLSHWILMDLARLRHEELLAEAARDRVANEVSANQPQRISSPLAAVSKWFIRLGQPVGQRIRRPA